MISKGKLIYIIPGWGETTKRKPYQKLKKLAEEKDYKVVFKNINWKEKLSSQIFEVEKNSIIFGFSLGAILAKLVAQENECEKLILASMTPLKYFKNKKYIPDLIKVCGKDFVYDINNKLKSKTLAKKQITFYGELENCKADIIVTKTKHEINDKYLKEIDRIM